MEALLSSIVISEIALGVGKQEANSEDRGRQWRTVQKA
jgi:hypothetical protein